MKRRANRFGLLFMGVFIGILAGILLAFWFNNSGLNFSFISDLFYGEKANKVSLRLADTESLDLTKKKHPNKYLNHKIDSLSTDSTELSLDEFLAYYGDEYPDTVLINAYQLSSENKAKDVVVIKDELLFIKQVEVKGLVADRNNDDLDSLLLDDRGYKKNRNNFVQVEFWKSPINFQGYKWDSRKLILFGFYEFDFLRIKYLNEQYYLQYGTLYYHLNLSDTFRPVSLITDDRLIKELNGL